MLDSDGSGACQWSAMVLRSVGALGVLAVLTSGCWDFARLCWRGECGDASAPVSDGAAHDAAHGPDQSVARDLAVGPDQTAGPDLAVVDLTVPDDLAPPPDLAVPPPPPDLATPPPPPDLTVWTCTPKLSPCDPVCQTGCDTGSILPSCNVSVATASGVQCQAAGAGQLGGACGAVTDCAIGLSCLSTLTAGGFCLPFCRTDFDCLHAGAGRCTWVAGAGGDLCTEAIAACDPVAQTGCLMGRGCYPDPIHGDVAECHAAGGGAQNAGCWNDYDCKAGYACAGFVGGGCQRTCLLGVAGQCIGTCTPVSGWTGPWGVCP
jgi:hypothetical protein